MQTRLTEQQTERINEIILKNTKENTIRKITSFFNNILSEQSNQECVKNSQKKAKTQDKYKTHKCKTKTYKTLWCNKRSKKRYCRTINICNNQTQNSKDNEYILQYSSSMDE